MTCLYFSLVLSVHGLGIAQQHHCVIVGVHVSADLTSVIFYKAQERFWAKFECPRSDQF